MNEADFTMYKAAALEYLRARTGGDEWDQHVKRYPELSTRQRAELSAQAVLLWGAVSVGSGNLQTEMEPSREQFIDTLAACIHLFCDEGNYGALFAQHEDTVAAVRLLAAADRCEINKDGGEWIDARWTETEEDAGRAA